MNPQNLPIKLKSTKDILSSIRDLTHRHWKRWLRNKGARNVEGCARATGTSKCTTCVGIPGSACAVPDAFVMTPAEKEKLKQEFREDINNPAKLIRDYRDVAMLLWVLGLLDDRDGIQVEERIVDEALRLGEAAQPRELKVALNFPVDADGYINIGNNDRIEAKTFIDAMKRFQEKPPTKATFVHERRIPDSAPRPMVVGNPQTGPEDRRALPKAGSEGSK